MDELRESSLLFSLEGLMETERERVQREAREAQRRRDDELRRVAELGERRRLAAQQEREARERRELIEQQRLRLEEERLAAIKQASVERVRIETEGQLRLIELEQQRKHDLALTQLREGQLSARYRTLSWLGAGGVVTTLGGALVLYFGLIAPDHVRAQQRLQAMVDESAAHTKSRATELAAERAKTQALSARVRELEQLAQAPVAAKPPVVERPGQQHGPVKRPPVTHQTRRPCGESGDPLDDCLH